MHDRCLLRALVEKGRAVVVMVKPNELARLDGETPLVRKKGRHERVREADHLLLQLAQPWPVSDPNRDTQVRLRPHLEQCKLAEVMKEAVGEAVMRPVFREFN